LIIYTHSLWNTLSNDGNGLDLWVVHELHGGAVNTTGRSKVDDGVDIGVLLHGLANILVDWEEGLAGTPVHLADELTTEGVDDTGDGWGGTLADEVKVEHALHGAGLETVDKTSGLVVEESVLSSWAQRSAWGSKTTDVVVGRASGSAVVTVGGSGRHCVKGKEPGKRLEAEKGIQLVSSLNEGEVVG
jgi:hypothetical protein